MDSPGLTSGAVAPSGRGHWNDFVRPSGVRKSRLKGGCGQNCPPHKVGAESESYCFFAGALGGALGAAFVAGVFLPVQP